MARLELPRPIASCSIEAVEGNINVRICCHDGKLSSEAVMIDNKGFRPSRAQIETNRSA
jgi:hypothetical protein